MYSRPQILHTSPAFHKKALCVGAVHSINKIITSCAVFRVGVFLFSLLAGPTFPIKLVEEKVHESLNIFGINRAAKGGQWHECR